MGRHRRSGSDGRGNVIGLGVEFSFEVLEILKREQARERDAESLDPLGGRPGKV